MNHQYTIGTVARLSGFSPHQLRKWESRLGLLIPDRAANGRRVYSEKQIDRLKMLRRLINAGYRIGDLAKMGEEHWYTLDPESRESANYRETCALISGKMICAVLDANKEHVPNCLTLQLSKNRLNCNVLDLIADVDVLVAEIGIVTKDEVKVILEAQNRGLNVLIVFRSCESELLKELISCGVVCMKAPVPPKTLIQQIKAFAKSKSDRSAEAIPQRRFSDILRCFEEGPHTLAETSTAETFSNPACVHAQRGLWASSSSLWTLQASPALRADRDVVLRAVARTGTRGRDGAARSRTARTETQFSDTADQADLDLIFLFWCSPPLAVCGRRRCRR